MNVVKAFNLINAYSLPFTTIPVRQNLNSITLSTASQKSMPFELNVKS